MLRTSTYVTILGLSCAVGGCDGTAADSDDDGSGGSGGSAASGSPTSTGTGVTSSTTSTSQATTSTGSGTDPYEAARAACITKINELRATKSLPPYSQWTSGESCADQQATSDEAASDPHGAFGMCGESGQNECLGAGPGGIESCLESMWAEKDQAGCSGCDACNAAYNSNCPNCEFNGATVCGHYVNMSALYFTEAACGFSSAGGWDVINFR